MKRRHRISILFFALTLLCAGCTRVGHAGAADKPIQTQAVPSQTDESSPDTSELLVDPGIETAGSIDAYLSAFEAQLEERGLVLEDKAVKDAESIGAQEGYGININSFPIEIYLFDPESGDERTSVNLKTAVEDGYITIFGVEINGEEPKPLCTFHQNLVLIFPSEDFGLPHPDKEAIIEAFLSIP